MIRPHTELVSFHKIDSLISFRKSTPPQYRQLIVLISNSQQVLGELVDGSEFRFQGVGFKV